MFLGTPSFLPKNNLDHGAERRQRPPIASFVQAFLVVGWQNKHDEGKEGTRIASDPPGNLLRGQCGLKRWPAKPLTEFQNPNQLVVILSDTS